MAIARKDDYVAMDKEYGHQMYKMYANSIMTWPSGVDASRLYMNTAETRQSLTLLNPDVPRLSNGWENSLGRLNKNRSYRQLDGTWEVIDKIQKYRGGPIYILVLYNAEIDTYDMIEKPVTENLSEKFGFFYNTEKMDSLKVGDVITDEIIYKSTSYDEHMNYRYGKNAKVMFSTSTNTIEDAVQIREGWAEGIESVEVDDPVTVVINNNDIPLNLYGKATGDLDDPDDYLSFPRFGEPVKNSCIFAKRPIKYEHAMLDFNNDALVEINSTDTAYYVAEAKMKYVYDVDIYYNGRDPFPNTSFYRQLHDYYVQLCEYADRIVEVTTMIKKSGSKYTNNVTAFKEHYEHFDDPEYEWCGKEKNKPIGYMQVDFKVQSILGIVPGSKIAGRFGDKGVISRIAKDSGSTKNKPKKNVLSDTVLDEILLALGREPTKEERESISGSGNIVILPDSEMPYTDDGPVDILLNASGAIRRLNPYQIYEVDLNFISEQIRKKVCSLPTIEEKKNLIFEYLGMLNKAQCDFFYEMYENFDKKYVINGRRIVLTDEEAKEAFIRDVEINGFYIRKTHDDPLVYDDIKRLYEHYDWIKPVPLYINKFGIKHRIIRDAVVADKYMMILKHNSNKNFSARSTFRVNRANLPVKDTTKRDNRSQYSKAPVRIGEAHNLMSSISPETLAEYNIFMRSSVLGRKSLKHILETDENPLVIKKLPMKDDYNNINADIFANKFLTLGLRINFLTDHNLVPDMIEDVAKDMTFGQYHVVDSPKNYGMYSKLFFKYLKISENYTIMESYPGEREDLIWDSIFEKDEEVKKMELSDDVKDMLKRATRKHYATEAEMLDDHSFKV